MFSLRTTAGLGHRAFAARERGSGIHGSGNGYRHATSVLSKSAFSNSCRASAASNASNWVYPVGLGTASKKREASWFCFSSISRRWSRP
jgi:hypothetical protein